MVCLELAMDGLPLVSPSMYGDATHYAAARSGMVSMIRVLCAGGCGWCWIHQGCEAGFVRMGKRCTGCRARAIMGAV